MAGFARATAILSANRSVLERTAAELQRQETLDEAALRTLTADLQPNPTADALTVGSR